MSRSVSIIFNPSTDSLADVQADVARLFGIFGALTGSATTAAVDDEAGDSVTNATYDKNGLPWDERIHSNPAKQTAKGEWRKRKNVDAALVTQVEAELRARMATGGVDTLPGVAAPVLAAPLALPPAAAPAVPTTYETMVKVITAELNTPQNPAGRINDAWVSQALTALNVPGGVLQNVATMTEAAQLDVLKAFKTSLGIA